MFSVVFFVCYLVLLYYDNTLSEFHKMVTSIFVFLIYVSSSETVNIVVLPILIAITILKMKYLSHVVVWMDSHMRWLPISRRCCPDTHTEEVIPTPIPNVPETIRSLPVKRVSTGNVASVSASV